MTDWIKLTNSIDYQKFCWSPRNTAEDAELIHLAKTGKYYYFPLNDTLDVLGGKSKDGKYTYLVIDWEENVLAEDTNNSISFRILNN